MWGTGSSLVLPSSRGRDPVVEGERVPREPAVRPERRGDALERASAVGPGREVQERAERAVDERGRLVEREVAHVALAQVELDARLGRAGAGLLEHRRRGVDPDDLPAGRLRDRNGDAAVPDGELDERAVGLTGKLDVEGDVGRHVGRPLVVAVGERLVPARWCSTHGALPPSTHRIRRRADASRARGAPPGVVDLGDECRCGIGGDSMSRDPLVPGEAALQLLYDTIFGNGDDGR